MVTMGKAVIGPPACIQQRRANAPRYRSLIKEARLKTEIVDLGKGAPKRQSEFGSTLNRDAHEKLKNWRSGLRAKNRKISRIDVSQWGGKEAP